MSYEQFIIQKSASAVFSNITGMAATNCFGVKGMAYRSMTDGLVHLLRREAMSKGFPSGKALGAGKDMRWKDCGYWCCSADALQSMRCLCSPPTAC